MPRIAAVGSSDAAVANNVESNSSTGEDGSSGARGNAVGQVPFHKPGTKSARGAAGGRGRGGRGGSRGGSSRGGAGRRQDPLKGGFKFGGKK